MPRRESLFWDTDPKKLDPQKHADYIIRRVLDYGNKTEMRWLNKQYPAQKIRSILGRSHGALHEKSQRLWSIFYK